jgi:hypothetical protein
MMETLCRSCAREPELKDYGMCQYCYEIEELDGVTYRPVAERWVAEQDSPEAAMPDRGFATAEEMAHFMGEMG